MEKKSRWGLLAFPACPPHFPKWDGLTFVFAPAALVRIIKTVDCLKSMGLQKPRTVHLKPKLYKSNYL